MGLGTPLLAADGWLMLPTLFVRASVPRGTRLDCLLKDRAWDWWEEIGHALGDDAALDAMTWSDFLARFRAEFSPIIEVQQLAREFQDLT